MQVYLRETNNKHTPNPDELSDNELLGQANRVEKTPSHNHEE